MPDPSVFEEGGCAAWTSLAEIRAYPGCAAAEEAALAPLVPAVGRTLYVASAQRFPGLCPDRIRPTGLCGALGSFPPNPAWPVEAQFAHVQQFSGGLTDPMLRGGLRCSGFWKAPLDLGPGVVSVEEVVVAGETLDPSTYRLIGQQYLARLDGVWPCCPDVTVEPPRFEVAFSRGPAVPANGRLAASALAGEIFKARSGDQSCGLNRRVRQVIRAGVTIDVALPGLVDALKEGKTGVADVDLFLWAENPQGLRSPPVVLVPGEPPPFYRP